MFLQGLFLLGLFSVACLPVTCDVINCKTDVQIANEVSGTIVIKSNEPCVIEAKPGSKFFGLKTDNLKLHDDEFIVVTPGSEKEKPQKISGPIVMDYLVFALYQVKIEFMLKRAGDNSIMSLEYFQDDDKVPIDGDKSSDMSIVSFGATNYQLAVTKSIKDLVHLKVSGTSDSFGHLLITNSSDTIPIQGIKNDVVFVTTAHVRQDCSMKHTDKAEESHEIVGPASTTITDKYKCVNIFESKQGGQAHYDVDFANFLDFVDAKDELTIDDGNQALKINSYTAKHYYQSKPTISFIGQKLAVIYDSPQKFNPKAVVFKLTINAKLTGGVVTQKQALSLPDKGFVRYTLRPKNNDVSYALLIKGKFSGLALKISDTQNNAIVLDNDKYVPPVIALNQAGQDTILEFNISSKVSATFNYDQTNKCSGTIFGSSGTISIDGESSNDTCYWLIGSSSTFAINYHDLQQADSCLKVYSLEQEKPIFDRCKIGSTEILPPFTLSQAYLAVKTASKTSKFEASVSKAVVSLVQATTGTQTFYKSMGYPASYAWSALPDQIVVDSTNKSVILSVADLDVRAGEKLTIDGKEITSQTYLSIGDIDISKKLAVVNLQRSLATNDFGIRRGYSLVTSQFQAIISADMNKTSIETPKNLTSLLLRFVAVQSNRLAYNISGATSNKPDYIMKVIDSTSFVGRNVYEDEKSSGSTTSNTLLISFESTTSKTLPVFKIGYSQLACNKTVDHICDQSTRCVPANKLCKGKSYCQDGTDLKVVCSGGPAPKPEVITTGYGGGTVFLLSILMLALGAMGALYGPNLYKSAENRFRSGQYTTFSSTE